MTATPDQPQPLESQPLESQPLESQPLEPQPLTPDPQSLSIRQAQADVDQWIRSVGVRYFNELTNLAQLQEEVGEVARIVSRTYGEQSWRKGETPGQLADELADVLFVVICLANQTGIDLEQALRGNLEKKTQRDAQRHLENLKLTHSYNDQ